MNRRHFIFLTLSLSFNIFYFTKIEPELINYNGWILKNKES